MPFEKLFSSYFSITMDQDSAIRKVKSFWCNQL